jgi:hypothetical protein
MVSLAHNRGGAARCFATVWQVVMLYFGVLLWIENFQISAILGYIWGIDIRKKNKIKKTKNVYIIEASLKTARCQKLIIRGKKRSSREKSTQANVCSNKKYFKKKGIKILTRKDCAARHN